MLPWMDMDGQFGIKYDDIGLSWIVFDRGMRGKR